MQAETARGVPLVEHTQPSNRGNLDWENVRIFLDVARSGSFRAAANMRRWPVNRIRRGVERLEKQSGWTLLLRNFTGVQLTPEGLHVLDIAQQMESASRRLLMPSGRAATRLEGEVRVAATEGLGTFWLVPRLVDYQRAHPRLLVDLRCGMNEVDLSRFEADVALQLVRPRHPDLKALKVGTLHIMPFASPGYLERYSEPLSREDLEMRHKTVFLFAAQGDGKEFYEHNFPGKEQLGFVSMRTNTTAAHAWAVAKGAGIGWLPTYAQACGARVVPLDLDMRFKLDMWLVHHPGASRIARVRHTIEWIADNCSPKRFPWFRDTFIHPREFDARYAGPPLMNLFEGFVGFSPESYEPVLPGVEVI